MSAFLDLLYRHRLLQAKCESGAELAMEEIQELATLEPKLPARRSPTRALLCRGELGDWVEVRALSAGGMVCAAAPRAEAGRQIEVRLEDETQRRSYRFKARVEWVHAAESGFKIGLRFCGAPLLIRKNPHGDKVPAVIEQFAA